MAVSSDCIGVVLFGGWKNDLLTAGTDLVSVSVYH